MASFKSYTGSRGGGETYHILGDFWAGACIVVQCGVVTTIIFFRHFSYGVMWCFVVYAHFTIVVESGVCSSCTTVPFNFLGASNVVSSGVYFPPG